jgi:hypothetical protein
MAHSRYGYHERPTTLVLTFDQALEAAAAQDSKNYRIIGPKGRIIRVKSAVYNASANTVTLHPSSRISVHYRYTLVVDGSKPGGLTNARGQLLDGTHSGEPGSNLRTSLTWRNLVLDSHVVLPKNRPATGNSGGISARNPLSRCRSVSLRKAAGHPCGPR